MSLTAFPSRHYDVELEIINDMFDGSQEPDANYNPLLEYVDLYPSARMSTQTGVEIFTLLGFNEFNEIPAMTIKNDRLPELFAKIEHQRKQGQRSRAWRNLAIVVAATIHLKDDLVVS